MNKSDVIPNIYLITGKGGVGKSTVATALAMAKSRAGERVLLVELGESSYNALVFDVLASYKPILLQKNMELALWNGEDCLREFIGHIIKIDRIVKLFFDNKVMKTFVRAAPALKELAVLGKLTSAQRSYGPKMEYDTIIVDGYSSGHFLSLLRVPKGMGETVKFGPMGEQSWAIDKVLRDNDRCRILVVTLPEELPIQEAIEVVDQLKTEFGKRPSLIVNKYIDLPVSEEVLKQMGQEESANEPTRYLLEKLRMQSRGVEKLRAHGILSKSLEFVYNENTIERLETLSHQLDEF